MVELRSRYRGTLLGVHAGDSAGAPYETMKGSAIRADLDRRGGLTLFDHVSPFKGKRQVKKGQPTDDSELTAALAESLIAYPEFNPNYTYHRLRKFIHGSAESPRKSILTDGEAYGSGGTLRAALRALTYQESFLTFREGRVSVIPTNGSLMRSASVALCEPEILSRLIEIAWRQSCITHVHPHCQVACVAYSVLLGLLLKGVSPAIAWPRTLDVLKDFWEEDKKTPDKILWPSFELLCAMDMTEPDEDKIWPNTGDVLLSLRVAIWSLMTAKDFVDGLTRAIEVGGDVDTYGAIAGGLLGAHFGMEGIPDDWQEALIGGHKMISYADEFYSARLLKT